MSPTLAGCRLRPDSLLVNNASSHCHQSATWIYSALCTLCKDWPATAVAGGSRPKSRKAGSGDEGSKTLIGGCRYVVRWGFCANGPEELEGSGGVRLIRLDHERQQSEDEAGETEPVETEVRSFGLQRRPPDAFPHHLCRPGTDPRRAERGQGYPGA